MKNFFERLGFKNKKKFLFTTKDLAQHTGNGDRINTAGTGTISNSGFYSINDGLTQWVGSTNDSTPSTPNIPEDKRKPIEPKAVFEELKKQVPDVSFDNLDEKIKVVTDRIRILSEHLDEAHLKDEHMTLFYLKNRKTYLKTRGKYPFNWATTTRDAVEDLCKNYKLQVVPVKQYYTLIPKEGVEEMDRYTKAYKAVTGDKPIYELVIKDTEVKTEAGQKQKKKDRDPILLANSPFGNALFVLGAWDEEVAIVDDIIYHLK